MEIYETCFLHLRYNYIFKHLTNIAIKRDERFSSVLAEKDEFILN